MLDVNGSLGSMNADSAAKFMAKLPPSTIFCHKETGLQTHVGILRPISHNFTAFFVRISANHHFKQRHHFIDCKFVELYLEAKGKFLVEYAKVFLNGSNMYKWYQLDLQIFKSPFVRRYGLFYAAQTEVSLYYLVNLQPYQGDFRKDKRG